jgi:serine/threonine-protein kinase
VAATKVIQEAERSAAQGKPLTWAVEPDFWQRFKLLDTLGSGTYGTVGRVRRLEDGAEFALKTIYRVNDDTKEELAVLQLVTALCPELMQYYGAFMIPDPMRPGRNVNAILMELIPGPTLFKLIDSSAEPIDPQQARKWLLQVSQQLACLHRAGIIHADVKPENIVIQNGNGRARLIDFGLACTTGRQPITKCNLRRGSRLYIEPAWFDGPISNYPAADIWSLGISWLELLLAPKSYDSLIDQITDYKYDRNTPLENATILRNWLASNSFYPQDKELENLVKSMLAEPQRRPTAEEIVQQLRDSPSRDQSPVRH